MGKLQISPGLLLSGVSESHLPTFIVPLTHLNEPRFLPEEMKGGGVMSEERREKRITEGRRRGIRWGMVG